MFGQISPKVGNILPHNPLRLKAQYLNSASHHSSFHHSKTSNRCLVVGMDDLIQNSDMLNISK